MRAGYAQGRRYPRKGSQGPNWPDRAGKGAEGCHGQDKGHTGTSSRGTVARSSFQMDLPNGSTTPSGKGGGGGFQTGVGVPVPRNGVAVVAALVHIPDPVPAGGEHLEGPGLASTCTEEWGWARRGHKGKLNGPGRGGPNPNQEQR